MRISVPLDVKKFIDQEIARPIRSTIVPLVQQGYELVDSALKEVSFFNWEIGRRHMGYLDNLAVQFMLYEAAKQGTLHNINAEIVPNKNKSDFHVELKTKNVILTINRTRNKNVTARKAIFRTILQKDNQYFWNFNEEEINEQPGYLQLTHNHINRRVDYINLGVPNGKGKWFSCIDLTKELHLAGAPKEIEKNEITREQLVKFKNFAQGVHENGGKN